MTNKIICMANQKGGVGKTTTAVNLSACLATAERRTLLVDCDAQGNATSGLGIDRESIRERNLYHALIGGLSIKDVIHHTQLQHLDIVPADQNLIGVEIEFVSMKNRETRLRQFLKEADIDYDFIVLDSPPSLGFLTINALVASDFLIVPALVMSL